MGDSLYREQYIDAVACYMNEQEQAGLDIFTDGDTRFDLEVGGRSWFFYTIERLNGVSGFRDSSHFLDYADIKPGHILYEVQEAYHPPAVTDKVTRGPLHFSSIWKNRAEDGRQTGKVRLDQRHLPAHDAVERIL